MLKDKIKAFAEKYPKFDLTDFIINFENGLSREKLEVLYECGEMPLRQFCYSIGLDFPKSKRVSSVERFKYNLSLEDGEDIDAIQELSQDITTLTNKNVKLYKALTNARDEANALRQETRKLTRQERLEDIMLDSFERMISQFNFTYPEIVERKLLPSIQREGLCITFSDEHSGDVVTPDVTPHNTYNHKVMRNRIMKVVDEAISYNLQSDNLVVFQLLDLLKGIIHDGLHTSENGITNSMLNAADVYVEAYLKLSANYDEINVYVTNSNHDRKTEIVSNYMKWDNFGIMIMKFVERILKSFGVDNINFHYTMHEYQFVEINGEGILAFHGDATRGYKPHLAHEVSKLQDICTGIYGKRFKHTISGHLHVAQMCHNQYGGVCIVNGTPVGNTEYGSTSGYRPIIPSQTVFFVNRNGDIEDIKFINLSRVTE